MAVDKEKRNARQYSWQKNNRDRINFIAPKGMKERLLAVSCSEGINVTQFILRAIENEIKRVEGGES